MILCCFNLLKIQKLKENLQFICVFCTVVRQKRLKYGAHGAGM